MICFPNAKINLGLNIISKRTDGYHNLETIFYPLAIEDALEVTPSGNEADNFIESGLRTGTNPENNLVIKALNLVRQNYNVPPVNIHLLKKIPFGAGIGGGSSDAACMIKLLNDVFKLNIQQDKMLDMALKLGADCPFFIYNRPMFASGIGEKLEEIELNLQEYYLVLVKPDIHIPTKDAFSLVKPLQPSVSLKEIAALPVEQWRNQMCNDFEKSIFPKYPVIQRIKEKLYDLGAVYAAMSGSGSSVYGIFCEETFLEDDFPGYYVWEETKSW